MILLDILNQNVTSDHMMSEEIQSIRTVYISFLECEVRSFWIEDEDLGMMDNDLPSHKSGRSIILLPRAQKYLLQDLTVYVACSGSRVTLKLV